MSLLAILVLALLAGVAGVLICVGLDRVLGFLDDCADSLAKAYDENHFL